jgi:CheY-like chemotaxis protein
LLLKAGAADGQRFELLIADHQMPDLSGLELCQAVREDASLAGTRLMLLTSVRSNLAASALEDVGISSCLSKPIQPHELLAAVESALAQPAGKSNAAIPRSAPRVLPQSAHERFEGHVLVVDDNLVNQKVAQRHLQKVGCTVTIASDGEEAVRRHSASRFDLIFMDLQMPTMDGYEAARRIRAVEHAENRHTPIVALSADAMSTSIEAARSAGMDHFLTKPIEMDRLRDALGRYLRRSSSASVAASS